jgi:hypothetical protein
MRILLSHHPGLRGALSRVIDHGRSHALSAGRVGYVLREP